MCGACVQDGVPYHEEYKATVKVRARGLLPALDIFCCPPLPEPLFLPPHGGFSPVHPLHLNRNTIFGSPLCTSCLCSLSLPSRVLLVSPKCIHFTIVAGDLIHHSCLVLLRKCLGVLCTAGRVSICDTASSGRCITKWSNDGAFHLCVLR